LAFDLLQHFGRPITLFRRFTPYDQGPNDATGRPDREQDAERDERHLDPVHQLCTSAPQLKDGVGKGKSVEDGMGGLAVFIACFFAHGGGLARWAMQLRNKSIYFSLRI
jgi:hypothetical protein